MAGPNYSPRRETIKKLRAELEKGNLLNQALKNAGIRGHDWMSRVSKSTAPDRFKMFIETLKMRSQITRDDMVEDAQFKRLATGKASGSEYEFYLTNRRTDRWKKLNEFGSSQGAPLLIKPPQINYISVAVTVPSNGNGKDHSHEVAVVTQQGRIENV